MTCEDCQSDRNPSVLAILALLSMIGATAVVCLRFANGPKQIVIYRSDQTPRVIFTAPEWAPAEPNHQGRR